MSTRPADATHTRTRRRRASRPGLSGRLVAWWSWRAPIGVLRAHRAANDAVNDAVIERRQHRDARREPRHVDVVAVDAMVARSVADREIPVPVHPAVRSV